MNDNVTGDGSYEEAVSGESLSRRRGALFVPAVVETPRYATDVVLTNVASTPLLVTVWWRPVGSAAVTTFLSLASGEQRVIPRFVRWLRDAGVPGVPPEGSDLAGALELSAGPDGRGLLAGARTATGGFGVFTPAIGESEAAQSRARIVGLRQDAAVRSNLAIVNLGGSAARFTVFLHRATDGARVVTLPDVVLAAGEWRQFGGILAEKAPGVPEMFAVVTATPVGSTPLSFRGFIAYAVVNEGARPGLGSGDGSFVPMQIW